MAITSTHIQDAGTGSVSNPFGKVDCGSRCKQVQPSISSSLSEGQAALSAATIVSDFAVPDDLAELDQWVLWRYEAGKGRPTKVPVQPSGQRASSINPRTWVSYGTALDAWRRNPREFAGIGFVFSVDDPFAGIDFDRCIDDGQLKAWVLPIITALADTYMEVSPSSTGVKVWVRATLTAKGTKRDYQDGAIEIYDRGRFFSVTGRLLNGTPLQIEDHQADIDRLYAQLTGHPDSNPKADISDGGAVLVGDRHDYLLSVAAQFSARGMSFAEVYAATQVLNMSRCQPPKSQEEVRDMCRWVGEKEQQKRVARMPRPQTDTNSPGDAGMAARSCAAETNTAELANEITKVAHFARDPGGRLYVFKDGVYHPSGDLFVQQRVKGIMNRWNIAEKWTSRMAKEVAEYIRVDAPALLDRPPKDSVNLQNGVLDLCTRELRPHSHQFLSTVQLPITFDPAAKCPAWDRFIAEVFPADSKDVAWELPAWLMTPDTSIQKAVLLTGEGANGKSTYLRGLMAFIGKHNATAVSLHRFEQDKFAVARLLGRLANICPDLPSAHLATTSVFKALTGGDVVHAEYKYLDSFEFIPFAKLVFSANQPPRSDDSTHGFFRRWLVIPFTRTFEEGATETICREELDARLSQPDELSGLLNKALDALRTIRKCGGFTESASMRRAWSDFRTMTDSFAVWLDESTEELPDALVTKSDLMAAYGRYCTDAHKPPMTRTAFGLALKRLRPAIKEAQRTLGGKVQWAYLGMRLRTETGGGLSDA